MNGLYCRVRREGDEMVCGTCARRCDSHEALECPNGGPVSLGLAAVALGPLAMGVAALDAARTVDEPTTPSIPVELPAELALRMATAHDTVNPHGGDDELRIKAMRAAWRVFLDETL